MLEGPGLAHCPSEALLSGGRATRPNAAKPRRLQVGISIELWRCLLAEGETVAGAEACFVGQAYRMGRRVLPMTGNMCVSWVIVAGDEGSTGGQAGQGAFLRVAPRRVGRQHLPCSCTILPPHCGSAAICERSCGYRLVGDATTCSSGETSVTSKRGLADCTERGGSNRSRATSA